MAPRLVAIFVVYANVPLVPDRQLTKSSADRLNWL
jgi:hypothetical protein